jgi:glycosyltransferase involved in cell wall biosynthesis
VILGIDASNIRRGGGVTHLVELLRAANPPAHGFAKVMVWGGTTTLNRIEDRPWLVKSHQKELDGRLPERVFWQRFRLSKAGREARCDLLFVPGGSYAGRFRPVVAFSQNLLPFDWAELRRYGLSWMTGKLMLLRWTQSRTFRGADGLMFLTHYAQEVVLRAIGDRGSRKVIVPHGIDNRFLRPPRTQRPIENYSSDDPFRVLYVSIVDVYKHQGEVVEAVARLRSQGLPLVLDLVGPAYAPALRRLVGELKRVDPDQQFIRYRGAVSHEDLPRWYDQADLCVFASSCETFGQILLEAMSGGLPIACSNRSAMPEVLADGGVYFDPEDPTAIVAAISQLINSPQLRYQKASKAFRLANSYSWERCARDSFAFFLEVAGKESMTNTK